jgi:hypothetical protein
VFKERLYFVQEVAGNTAKPTTWGHDPSFYEVNRTYRTN